jgi:hypothetical protein|tara:strand:+ start:675 stop:860 length:186 start_codon:yes stop_codon:yes gene_type:complete
VEINVIAKDCVVITIGDWEVQIDNSTNERIITETLTSKSYTEYCMGKKLNEKLNKRVDKNE